MNSKFENSNLVNGNDKPSDALSSLLEHKNNILNSIKNEIYYSNLELKLIDYLFSLNSSSGYREESPSDPDNDLANSSKLLKFGSNEFHDTQDQWKNFLEQSFLNIQDMLNASSKDKKRESELQEAYHSIWNLQNAYFNSVQQRQNNMKLLLRLKMYANSRLRQLEDSLNDYQSSSHYKKLYPEPQAKLVQNNLKSEFGNKLDSEYKRVIKATLNKEIEKAIGNNQDQMPTEKATKSKCTQVLPIFKSPYSSNLLNVFFLTNSVDDFMASALTIYKKYGNNYMSFNVFNNILLFLVQSLHLPNLNRLPTDQIYGVYNVDSSSVLDFRTFSLLYWEVLHLLRRAIEIHYQPKYTFTKKHMYLNKSSDDEHPFVNISDYYSFIKRLSPGKSCTKYVAKELKTNELRVVEIFCKTPDLPSFHELYVEFERFQQLDHKNLVKYISLFHDYNTVYLVSEFCPQLSLLNNLKSLESNNITYSLAYVHNLFTQVVEALVYLHCNNVTHKSLSPEKIMVDDSSPLPRIKLRDYGMSDFLEYYRYQSPTTTLHYAPEALNSNFSPKSDVWSAGMLLFFMVTGELPSKHVNKSLFVDNLYTHLSNSNMFRIDDDLRDMITFTLSYEVSMRPTSFDLVSHPWFLATNLSKSGVNTRILSRTVNTLTSQKSYRNISKFLENSNTFYVNRLNKLINTLYLSREANDRDLITYGNFVKVLKMENFPNPVISELIQLTSLTDSDKCSLKEFLLACKFWRLGEINIFWSVCKKSMEAEDWSMSKNEYIEMLYESRSSLLMKEDANWVLRSIAVDDKVYWNHFVNFFM